MPEPQLQNIDQPLCSKLAGFPFILLNQVVQRGKNKKYLQKTDKKLFDECATDPLSSMVSQLESLSIGVTALLQPQGGLSPLGSSPGTWAEVRKSLHQANCLGPHHCYACGTPGVAHHLAQEAVDITLPSSSSTHPSTPCLSKAP